MDGPTIRKHNETLNFIRQINHAAYLRQGVFGVLIPSLYATSPRTQSLRPVRVPSDQNTRWRLPFHFLPTKENIFLSSLDTIHTFLDFKNGKFAAMPRTLRQQVYINVPKSFFYNDFLFILATQGNKGWLYLMIYWFLGSLGSIVCYK